jgi:hypothetical protein
MDLLRMLQVVLCVLANEVVCKSDIRVRCPVVLSTNSPPIVVSGLFVILETFVKETLRCFDIPKTVVESAGAVTVSLLFKGTM